MQPKLQIRLLGEFKVVAGDEPITSLNTPRLQALFAYLILHRDAPQPRQHIAFLFWPDSSEEQAQSNLRNLLMALRRAFPDVESYISIERRSLQWRNNSPFALDVIQFEQSLAAAENALLVARHAASTPHHPAASSPAESSARLQEAVNLYTGDLLPACYDEWVLAPREHLRQAFLLALTALVSTLEGEGELGTAMLYAQRLLRHDPLQEENYRRLLRLHLANGDRAGMVSVYRQCERVMRRELGVEPSDATRELLRRAEELVRHGTGEERGTRARTRGKGTGRTHVLGNLPAQTAVFIGREHEVAELSKLLRLPGRRLVTLTGTAGTGKTRLALQVASGLGDFTDGVFLVSLAPLSEPDMVERAIAQAVGVLEVANRPLRDSLLEALRDKQVLLVLDNFEHLLPAAPLVALLLAACPHLKVLVTSRAPLNLRGEYEYPVPPMSVPSRDVPPEPDDLLQYEAVALFVERALEVSPHFALTRGNARSISEICRKLEGLPLATELAAARIKALSPEAILSRLDRRLKLLVGGKLDLPPRHRALETAIAWSYNLLDDEEKRLFNGVSVFAGGCSLEAIDEVLGASEHGVGARPVLEGITSLLNKSLLVRVDMGGELADGGEESRFGMLETLREYALERLVESGEAHALFHRHALYFARLAEISAAKFLAPGQVTLFEQVEREHDNIRAALGWACQAGEAEVALRLAGSLDRFWERRGHLVEGHMWLERVLTLETSRDPVEQPEDRVRLARSRANALCGLGRFQFRLGQYGRAEATLCESVALFEAVGDKEGTADALNVMAVAVGMNEFDRGLAIHERCLAIRRDTGDRLGIIASLQNIATIKVSQGKHDEAQVLCQEALALHQGQGDNDSKAAILFALGTATAGLGDYEGAGKILGECIDLCRELKHRRLMAWALYELAGVAYLQGAYEQSRLLNAEARDIFVQQGAEPGIAHAHARMGRDEHHLGHYHQAGQHYSQALSKAARMELQPALGQTIAGIAGLAVAVGRPLDAARLFGSAETILSPLYSSLEREAMASNMDEARAALGEETWAAAWAEGRAMPWKQAVALAHQLL